jgi:hypothetical protein
MKSVPPGPKAPSVVPRLSKRMGPSVPSTLQARRRSDVLHNAINKMNRLRSGLARPP